MLNDDIRVCIVTKWGESQCCLKSGCHGSAQCGLPADPLRRPDILIKRRFCHLILCCPRGPLQCLMSNITPLARVSTPNVTRLSCSWRLISHWDRDESKRNQTKGNRGGKKVVEGTTINPGLKVKSVRRTRLIGRCCHCMSCHQLVFIQ